MAGAGDVRLLAKGLTPARGPDARIAVCESIVVTARLQERKVTHEVRASRALSVAALHLLGAPLQRGAHAVDSVQRTLNLEHIGRLQVSLAETFGYRGCRSSATAALK